MRSQNGCLEQWLLTHSQSYLPHINFTVMFIITKVSTKEEATTRKIDCQEATMIITHLHRGGYHSQGTAVSIGEAHEPHQYDRNSIVLEDHRHIVLPNIAEEEERDEANSQHGHEKHHVAILAELA